ncbi:hypothetical protein C0Z18_11785 [Trinickia dabaoshanensis]|uniref:HTH luxR-type domain-containing protein n=1 Tax=Trinickia dabaoshanensis TaxID=564714 RepID=A0A2N7VSR1_9BURK|nr:hypothetical protein C0Z18_11785 [Trinickia dabaoshanensis]
MMPTTREGTVLALIAEGLTDREIAARLAFSLSTARKHREALLAKFGATKSAQLVRRYVVSCPNPIKKSRARRRFPNANNKCSGCSMTARATSRSRGASASAT